MYTSVDELASINHPLFLVTLFVTFLRRICGNIPEETALPPTFPFNSNNLPGWVIGLSQAIVFGAIIFSQIYRYRRMSTRVERQQTRWVVSGIIIMLVGIFVILPIFGFFFPTLNQPNIPSSQIFGLRMVDGNLLAHLSYEGTRSSSEMPGRNQVFRSLDGSG